MEAREVEKINAALKHIYDSLGADNRWHVEPVACAQEGIAQVLYNLYFTHPQKKVRIATPPSAEAAIQLTADRIGERVEIPLDEGGQVTLAAVEQIVDQGVDLISLSYADGLTGVVHPIEEIAQLCMDRMVLLHVDATHALGSLYFKLSDLPIDYFTLDLPKSDQSLLFIKEGAPFKPLILGKNPIRASHMEGLAQEVAERIASFDALNLETSRLRDHFEAHLEGARPLFQQGMRLPHISCLAFEGIAAETLLFSLNRLKVLATLGGGIYPKLSHILKKCRYDPKLCYSALSFTFAPSDTQLEVQERIAAITQAALVLQSRAVHLFGGAL